MSNIRISQLPTAPSAITGSELIPIVQNGQTVQTTVSAIVNSPVETQTFLTKNNEPTLPNSRYLAVGSGLSLTDAGAQSTYQIALNGAIANLNGLSNGLVTKSGTNTLVNRSVAVSGNGLAVSNADGVAGNPTLSVINNLANIAGASGTGILAIAGANTLNILNIAGTSNQISVSNADGSTGNPTIALANNPVVPGTASLTLPIGGTALRPSGVNGMLRYNSDTSNFEGYSAGVWGAIISGSGVSSFSAGTTGLTPSSITTGGITLGGVLNAANGGTGVAGTLTGFLYGNGTSAHTVGTTAQLLTLLGTVPIANGGTGQTTATTAFNALSPLTTSGDLLYASATNTAGRLPIGSSGQILSVVGGFPAWASLSSGAVTSFSGGSTGLTPVSPSTGAISLAGTLNIGYGGTGVTATPLNGQVLIGNGSGYALSTLTAGTGISITNGAGSVTIAINGTGEVTSFQTSLSGLTPATATGGAITLAGTLGVISGGTSFTSYTTGDMLYASSSTTFSKLGIGASGYVLSSTGSSPNWVALSTLGVTSLSFGTTGLTPSTATSGAITVAGTLAVANGGTGVTASSGANSVVLRDANVNISYNNTIPGYLTTITTGTVTLTVASPQFQRAQGSITVTYQLPNATTMAKGQGFYFDNDTANNVTVQDSTSTVLAVSPPGAQGWIFVEDNSTAAGSWSGYAFVPGAGPTGAVTWGTAGIVMGGGAISGLSTLGLSGQLTSTVSTGTAPFVVSSTTQVANLNAANAGTTTLAAGSGATNYITFSSSATGNAAQFTNTSLTYNYTNNAITGGIQGGGF